MVPRGGLDRRPHRSLGGRGPRALSGARQGQVQAGLQGQGSVHLPGGPQAVPLGNRPPGVGQHVGPVLQGLTRGPRAQQHLAHGLGPEVWAPGPDGQHQIHALGEAGRRAGRERKTGVSLAPRVGPPPPPPPPAPPTPFSRQPTWTWLKGTRKVKASLKEGAAVPFRAEVFLFFHFLWFSMSWTFT